MHGYYPQCHFVAQDGAWSSSCVCGLFRKKAKVRGAYDFDAKSSFIISVKTHLINFICLSLATAVHKGTLEIQYFTWSPCCCHQPCINVREEEENGYSVDSSVCNPSLGFMSSRELRRDSLMPWIKRKLAAWQELKNSVVSQMKLPPTEPCELNLKLQGVS